MANFERTIESKIDELAIKSKNSKWSAFLIFFYLYRYKLRSARDQVLKITLWSSILIMIVATTYSLLPFTFVSAYEKYSNQLTILLIGFATSLLAATFIEIFERVRKEHKKFFSNYNLRRLFSCSSDKDRVIISLSKFEMSKQKESVGLFRDGNDKDLIKNGNTPEEDPHYFSNIAYSDAIAAANIASLFTNNGMSLPKIFLDMEIVGSIFDDNSIIVNNKRQVANYPFDTYTLKKRPQDQIKLNSALKYKKLETIICIGLYSNEITMWLNSRSDKNLFQIIKRDITNNPIGKFKLRERIEDREIDFSSWDSMEYVGKVVDKEMNGHKQYTDQFAIIAKIVIGRINFIIVGGQTALATKEISRHLYKDWDNIARNVFLEQESRQANANFSKNLAKSFAYIFEIKPRKGVVKRDIYPKYIIHED